MTQSVNYISELPLIEAYGNPVARLSYHALTAAIKDIHSVQSVDHSCTEVVLSNGQRLQLEQVLSNYTAPTSDVVVVSTDNHIYVAGLSHHAHPMNPLESDGEGEIVLGNRYGTRESRLKLYEALGLDRDGDPDLHSDAVCQELGNNLITQVKATPGLMRTLSGLLRRLGVSGKYESVYQTLEYCCSVAYWHDLEDAIAYSFTGVRYFHQLSDELREKLQPIADLCSEAQAVAAWQRCMRSGRLGNQHAVLIDSYEHGNVEYRLTGQGYTCPWDTSSPAGAWIPDDLALANVKHRAAGSFGEFVQFKHSVAQDGSSSFTFSLDKGKAWSDPFSTLDLAIDAAIQSNDDIAAAWKRTFRATLEKYCSEVLESYTAYVNGECYDISVYKLDSATGAVVGETNEHGVFSHSNAVYDLHDLLLGVVRFGALQ